MDEMSKGIVLNCLFRELVQGHYPGKMISQNLADEVIDKMSERTNPFEQIRLKIEKMIEDKEHDKIIDELQKVLSAYSKDTNEIIDEAIKNFLFKVINNYQELDVTVLGEITNIYLDFIEDKKSDITTAVFFIRLASYLHGKNNSGIAKNCLIKSRDIYNKLGFQKDVEKVDRILQKFASIKEVAKKPPAKIPKKKKKTKSKSKKKAKKK